MRILNAESIRAWDAFTINHEPIASINLMERASRRCFDWLTDHGYLEKQAAIYCGKGNNGGDGLALARMLAGAGTAVNVYLEGTAAKGTADFQSNLKKLHALPQASIHYIQHREQLPVHDADCFIIDALLGTGLSRPLEGWMLDVVNHINGCLNPVISIDIPTGLFTDRSSLHPNSC